MLVGDDDLKELLGSFISNDSIAPVPTGAPASATPSPKKHLLLHKIVSQQAN